MYRIFLNKFLYFKVDILFFLIRRNGCKEKALLFLKEMIENKVDIRTLSFSFNKFAEVYKKAHDERQFHHLETHHHHHNHPHAHGSQQSYHPDLLSNIKTSSSYNVVVQSDLHSKIFVPLSEDTVISLLLDILSSRHLIRIISLIYCWNISEFQLVNSLL